MLEEKIQDSPGLDKEYYKDELYDFALKLFRKQKSDSEIKKELSSMLDEILKPMDRMSNDFNFGFDSSLSEAEEEEEEEDSSTLN